MSDKERTTTQELVNGNPMLKAAAHPILAARRALRQELAGLEKILRDHAKQGIRSAAGS
jgi:hypothetical protein